MKTLLGKLPLLVIIVCMLAAGVGALWGRSYSLELGITYAYVFIIPILLGAFFYGQILGLALALVAGLVSGALVIGRPDALTSPITRQAIFQIIFFGIVALVTTTLAERERQAHARYRDLFLSAPLGMYRSTPEGRYLDANPALLQILGCPDRETLLSTPAAALYASAEDDAARCRTLEARGKIRQFETQMRRCDGSLVWVQEDSSVEGDTDGQALYYKGSLQDITVRKCAEDEICLLNADLENRVAERTAQLEAANRELEAFSYSVSHDLRAPLRGISGFSQALMEDYGEQIDEKGHKYLEYIRSAGLHMDRLIEGLLRLSRLGRAEMQPGRLDLSAMVSDLAAKLQHSQPERSVEFAIAPEISAYADANLMSIALHNLIENAWKFTSRQPAARIEFNTLRKDGRTVYYLRDNGAGFNASAAQRIFGAFQRQHSEAEFPGTGIGLATVERIIHRHGGLIWAEGAPGEGATFYFTLPEEP